MTTRLTNIISAFAILIGMAGCQSSPSHSLPSSAIPATGEELLVRKFDKGYTIAVVKIPQIDSAELRQLYGDGIALASPYSPCWYVVEARFPSGKTVELTKSPSFIPGNPILRDRFVGILGEPDEIIVAVLNTGKISLWRIQRAGSIFTSEWTRLSTLDRHALPLGRPGLRADEVTVAAVRLPDRRWQITTTEKGGPTRVYEQPRVVVENQIAGPPPASPWMFRFVDTHSVLHIGAEE